MLPQPPAPDVEWWPSYTVVHDCPEKSGVLDVMSTSNVKLVPLSSRNSLSIAPLPLLAGVPPVDTTVALPALFEMTSVLLEVSVPRPEADTIDPELAYVIELAPADENPKISDPEMPEPFMLWPSTFVLFLIPKYTLVCELKLTPVHVTVAPVLLDGMPDTEQLPPPGSE